MENKPANDYIVIKAKEDSVNVIGLNIEVQILNFIIQKN